MAHDLYYQDALDGVLAPVATGTSVHAPLLIFFYSARCGPSRQLDGYIAHALQRRGNHQAFRVRPVAMERRPDLFDRFGIEHAPAIVIMHDGVELARHEGAMRPRELQAMLDPWLM